MNQTVGINFERTEHGHDRSLAVQRWSAVLGGSALAIYGLTRRSPLGIAMAATGGAVAFLGARPETLNREIQAHSSILLNCTPEEAYRFWRNFENLPRFMNHLDNVTVTDNGRSRWTALGPMGRRVSWNAEIEEERVNEFIAWRSTTDSELQTRGFVSFRPAAANRGTLVETSMEVLPPAGALGAAAAKIFGKDPSFLIRQDLRRLKALIETGEIPTTDGQSHGPRSSTTAFARMMNPDRPIRSGAGFREVLDSQRRIS